MADLIMEAPPPELTWKPHQLKDRSILGKLVYIKNKILGRPTRTREFVPKELDDDARMWQNLNKKDLEKKLKKVDKQTKKLDTEEDHFPPPPE